MLPERITSPLKRARISPGAPRPHGGTFSRGGIFAIGLVAWLMGSATAPAFADDDATASTAIAGLETALDGSSVEAILEAMETVGELVPRVEDPKVAAKVAGLLSDALRFTDPENRVAIRAANLLGKLGEAGVPALARALRDRRLDRDKAKHPLRAAVIGALAETRSPVAVDSLVRALDHADPEVVILAADGLGRYETAPARIRKTIAGSLVEAMEAAVTANRSRRTGGGDGLERLQEPFNRVYRAAQGSLRRVTGKSFATSGEWSDWWKKARREKWKERD